MKTKQGIIAIVLLVLLAATALGMFHTKPPRTASPTSSPDEFARNGQAPAVDQAPLITAQRLIRMPITAEELPFAQEALRLGDREMDLAFAAAVRDAEEHPLTLSASAQDIQARLQQVQRTLDADKARLAQLTAAAAKASADTKDALDDQLNQAKAQIELDQDEVDEAKQDLMRAGGDSQGRIEVLTQEHTAASQLADSTHVTASVPVQRRGLIHLYQQWSELHQKHLQLWQAKEDAEKLATIIAAKHDAAETQVKAQKEKLAHLADQADAAPPTVANGKPTRHEQSAALVRVTKRKADDQKELINLDKRIDNEKRLAVIYSKWLEIVSAQQRAVVNVALQGLAIVLVIALLGLFFDSWLEKLLGKVSLDRRQVETLRTVTRVGVQIVAVMLILLVIFGPPSQLGTFLGLAGAGLTVALKDFIVAFFGWFVLMGKNGIRLGDWVEINGVTGEVVELGMFHTVLLETGNWTDSGHPTGRRVTFTNNFAIEGHYFNFSTSGQWLWDELQIVLPAGQNPYPVVDAIQKKVLEATADSARQAEEEWKHAALSRDMRALSATPAINVKPVIGGIEIAVRYITRAHERYQLRAKLYSAAVELLGQKNAPAPALPSVKPISNPT